MHRFPVFPFRYTATPRSADAGGSGRIMYIGALFACALLLPQTLLADADFPTEYTVEGRYFLSGIEVHDRRAQTIVTLGDSIT